MDSQTEKKISKFLSLVLRHRPELINIKLEEGGWISTATLLEQINQKQTLSLAELEFVVQNNDKQRFAFNEDKSKIRANQGHSTQVEMNYVAQKPPIVLYHGTATKNVKSILATGIKKGNRHYVHLSADKATAEKVGVRHGKPYIFVVRASAMQDAGFEFYRADNGVWLTDFVPAEFLEKITR